MIQIIIVIIINININIVIVVIRFRAGGSSDAEQDADPRRRGAEVFGARQSIAATDVQPCRWSAADRRP